MMDPSEDPHPMVEHDGILLDRQILGIVSSLWSLGVETVNSCQGDSTLEALSGGREFYRATVGFEDPEHARWFGEILEYLRRSRRDLFSDLQHVSITYTAVLTGEAAYYHVAFPPGLIPLVEKELKVLAGDQGRTG